MVQIADHDGVAIRHLAAALDREVGSRDPLAMIVLDEGEIYNPRARVGKVPDRRG